MQRFDVGWALTSAELGYYPLTWTSHMVDVQLFGLDAGAQHLMNVAIHAAASVVLLFLMLRLTNAPAASAIVAALFAVHPLHVESVAWIAERKDTLSALFGLLAVLAYVKRPRHWSVAAWFAASLLAKQTLVTLPLLLLILDYWPLGRASAQCTVHGAEESRRVRPVHCALCTVHSVREKLPLFALSLAATAAAVIGQRNLGALQTFAAQPLPARLANAVLAYATYLGKTFWPTNLAVMIPLTPHAPLAVAATALLLVAITGAAWLLRARFPFILAGWLWYAIALLPLSGIVQIGRQAMADRYAYLPSIGIFIAVVFTAARFAPRHVFAIGGAVVVLVLAAVSVNQTSYWRDTRSLFTHSIAITGPNLWADYILGQSLQMTDPEAALPPLRRASAEAEAQHQMQAASEAHLATGVALLTEAMRELDASAQLRLVGEGERECRQVLRISPHDARALQNLAVAEELRRRALSRAAAPR